MLARGDLSRFEIVYNNNSNFETKTFEFSKFRKSIRVELFV